MLSSRKSLGFLSSAFTPASRKFKLLLTASFLLLPTSAKAFDVSDIFPAFTKSTFGIQGAQTDPNSPDYSVGFFFDVSVDNYSANALGISAQSNLPWVNPYMVTLWKYDSSGGSAMYTKLAEKYFSPGDPNIVAYDDDNNGRVDSYWLPLTSKLPLENTGNDVDASKFYGYAIAASGSYNKPSGNFIEQDGIITFNMPFVYDGNGYNIAGNPYYPIPVYEATDKNDNPVYGYWNPNISAVPVPLPVVGPLFAIGWARRVRSRVRSAD